MSFIEKQLRKLMVELNKRLIKLKRLVNLKTDRKEEITQNGEMHYSKEMEIRKTI